MSQEYITKGTAISIISLATGYGRRAIENKIEELASQGLITVTPDPGDRRAFRITRADVDAVIQAFGGKRPT